MRTGGAQQAQLAERRLAGPGQNEDACITIEEHRKEAHCVGHARNID